MGFAGGPHLLLCGEVLLNIKYSKTNQPTKGINIMSCHQPERPISCKRLDPTAKVGINSIRFKIILKFIIAEAVS